ncbi:AGC/Akt protein kinase [Coprinopsis cinerea okayama7|uniref:AGC/Akt protein kinase n=1 Tax=Coprinopsis cinerea (strain Okayama-7 / 130 / ATCC MYA-4618 / FGSC 9003) TaxID=240176 RepID=A8NWP0_COPC7|nr:AGC/Akt protein kinase [Coprinopsis cinerea okayama7\|eukprot:XP_001836945.1 AGC/Akt protein kinase [Coprinopsis cinerea okayama7\
MSSPSPSSSSPLSASRGQIHVKLISARALNVRSVHARPYVVVQFEQNEFVSRDPTDEGDKEVKGVATAINSLSCSPSTPSISRDTSSSALSALGAIHAKASAAAAKAGRPVVQKTPSTTSIHLHPPSAPSVRTSSTSSTSSNTSTNAGGLFSRLSAHNPVWKHEVSFDVTSEDSQITLNVYDRAASDQGFLGTVQIKPILVHDHTVDQWFKLKPYENELVTGEIRVQITYEQYKTKRALTPRDFEFLKLIGRGTFGKVFQVRKKDTKRIYAMKVLSKKEIIAKKEVAHTIGERKILQYSLSCPFLVGLKFSFQTDMDLYLVTDFKSGGELFWHLQRETRFSEERARFYVAELILALEHLHKFNIVYRDLKPENILLDATGHVALCDFGLSKANLRADELTTTFCGTTEYLAPEILLDEQGYSKIVDFWSLGVLLFEMCCGWSPFYAEDVQQMYKNICFGKIRFPKGVIGEDGKQFVKGLLNRNPKHRLGAQRDAEELKEHPFFSCIDWTALSLKQVTPPFKPVVESDESTNNFDPEFTEADIRDPKLAGMFLDDEDDHDDLGYSSDKGGKEWLDEDDPSEDWVNAYEKEKNMGHHTPNGPLGWELHANKEKNEHPPKSASIQIKPSKKAAKKHAGTPLTSSVQENFRGFTYSGGESVVASMAAHAMRNRDNDWTTQPNLNGHDSPAASHPPSRNGSVGSHDGVTFSTSKSRSKKLQDEKQEPTTEDEAYDYSTSAGRLANAKRKEVKWVDSEIDFGDF